MSDLQGAPVPGEFPPPPVEGRSSRRLGRKRPPSPCLSPSERRSLRGLGGQLVQMQLPPRIHGEQLPASLFAALPLR